MKVGRSLILTTALLLGAGFVGLTSSPSYAAEVFAGASVVEILPTGTVNANGGAATIHAIALGKDGKPLTGLKLKAEASAGMAEGWNELGDGLYSFTYKPDAAGEVTLTLKGRLNDKSAVSSTAKITVSSPVKAAIEASANPPELVLGKSDNATLTFQLPEGVKAADLEIRASSGDIKTVTNMGGGKITAAYTAPKVNFPQLAMITVIDKKNPDTLLGQLTIPLQGSVAYPVEAEKGASVVLKIGGQEYGPAQADDSGKAKVPVVVPPGTEKAVQVTVIDGNSTEKDIDLRVPETRRVHLYPLTADIPSGETIKVRALVLDATGKPVTDAKDVSLTTSTGKVGAAKHVGNGMYEADFTSDPLNEAKEVELSLKLGDSDKQVDSLKARLLPARPGKLVLRTDPESRSAMAAKLTAYAKLVDGKGKNLSGQNVAFEVQGGTLEGELTDLGGGDYKQAFKAPPKGDTTVSAYATAAVSKNPARHVFIAPVSDNSMADGASATTVVVAAVDAWGYPVAGVDVKLSAEGGKLPESAKTNDKGVATVTFTAGKTPGLARLKATAGDAIGEAAVVLSSEALALDLPANGTDAARALRQAFTNSVASKAIPLDGAGGGVAVAAAPEGEEKAEEGEEKTEEGEEGAGAKLADGEEKTEEGEEKAEEEAGAKLAEVIPEEAPEGTAITVLDVTTDPNKVAPNGTVTVTVIAYSEDGKGVPGAEVEFLTSAGKLGETQALEGGRYRVELKIPKNAEGEVKISAVAGDLIEMVKVEVSEDAVAAAPEEKAEKPAKEPKPEADNPWLRARLSGVGSMYSFSQTPGAEPGPLLSNTLTVGGNGGAGAYPMGGELDVRGYFDEQGLPYVGFHVNGRATRYAVAASAFDGEAPDTLWNIEVDALGRYPFQVGADTFWVGGKVGFSYDDFMVFKGCLETGCTVEYSPLAAAGLGLGAEIGAEVGPLYFIGGFAESFAKGTQPYAMQTDINVGYHIIENAFVDLGFSSVNRKISLKGKDTGTVFGELADNQILFKLGGGVAF